MRLANFVAAVIALPTLLSATAQANSITYTYTSPMYNHAESWFPAGTGPITFSFTKSSALAANLNNQSQIGSLLGWAGSAKGNAGTTIGSAVAGSSLGFFDISTDSLGNIVNWYVTMLGPTSYYVGSGGKELITSYHPTNPSLLVDGFALFNPPGVNTWPYRIDGLNVHAECYQRLYPYSCGGTWTTVNNIDQVETPPATPSAVPLPAALPLMLSGLGVLGFASRRRKETAV